MFSSTSEEETFFDVPEPETTRTQLQEADQRQLLERALDKLPPAQRIPLVLFHFEDLGYEEIAKQLGISLAKVKTDIFRGREALRKKLRLQLGSEDEWADYQPQATPEPKPPRTKSNPMRYPRALLA